jgi:septal ring factor EnvC (AmiA/AmiB activator)
MGGVIVLAHDPRHHTVYAHVLERTHRVGSAVAEGETLSVGVGPSAWGTTELYFEVRVDGVPVDPADWLRR